MSRSSLIGAGVAVAILTVIGGVAFQRDHSTDGAVATINRSSNRIEADAKHSSTRLQLRGHWNQLKGKLKQRYADLTDDDLLYVEGKEEEFYSRLQKKWGKSRAEIDRIFDDLQ